MNDVARAIRKGGRSVVELPEGIALEAGPLSVRLEGRTIVLEPIGSARKIAPGAYTSETLPPLSEGARRILASLDAVAPLVDPAASLDGAGGTKALAGGARGIEIEEAAGGIGLSDEGLRGLDPAS